MLRGAIIPVILLLLSLQVHAQDGNIWKPVGGVGISSGEADSPSIAVDHENRAWIAYRDIENNRKTIVLRWNNEDWEPVGEGAISEGRSSNQNLIIDETGNVWLAYIDGENNHKPVLRKWSGTEWEMIGQEGISSGPSDYLDITIDHKGRPWAAFKNLDRNRSSTVKKWNGSDWLNMNVETGISQFQNIAVDQDGRAWLIFKNLENEGKTSVLWMDPQTGEWSTAGSKVISDERSRHQNIEIDKDGVAWIAYEDYEVDRRTTVRKWNSLAQQWELVGEHGISDSRSWYQNLVFDSDGTPWISFNDGGTWPGPEGWKPTVMQWNGFSWNEVGGRGISFMGSRSPNMAIGPDGIPWVGYKDKANFNRITVRRWQQPGDEEIIEQLDLPVITRLHQNYPNPFNPETTIEFELPRNYYVTLDVYSSDGRHIANLVNSELPQGTHSVIFDGSELATGTYIYRLVAGGIIFRSKTMAFIK